MYIWEGKIKGYNTNGEYIGTFRAVIRKDGNFLFRMSLYFDSTHKNYKNPITKNEFVSSNLEVLKRKFRTSLPIKEKTKIVWRKKKEC
ncbi:hypothetical protein [Alkalihalobacillus sp. BA299]|uniref:hypothetical protein n=1 Tax=Alkalihalobacillus sp. BA299 TaxID=2815938 RepID=UPI001ADAF0E5|nr:hypothetical protein [Alkalihalobacillus sp. BA299]